MGLNYIAQHSVLAGRLGPVFASLANIILPTGSYAAICNLWYVSRMYSKTLLAGNEICACPAGSLSSIGMYCPVIIPRTKPQNLGLVQ